MVSYLINFNFYFHACSRRILCRSTAPLRLGLLQALNLFVDDHNPIHFQIDPCEDVKCSFNSRCVVNSNYKTSCQCPKCPPTTKRVCASDGRTYINECEMKKESCTTKTNIRVLHPGKCSKYISF